MIENQLRKLGKTGLYFCPMGLGTASFSGVNMTGSNNYQKPSEEQIDELINNALLETNASKNNKLIIDTSSQYGESELRIGNYIKNNHDKIEKIYICTKWGLKFKSEDFTVQDYSLKNLKESLENSFKLLSKIDLFYIHTNPSVNTDLLKSILNDNNEVINYFKKIKEDKKFKIKYLGISISSEENLRFLIKNKLLLKGIDVLQINANILLNNPEIARQLEYLEIGIIVNSVYRKGDIEKRNNKEGLQEIFSDVLEINKNIIILTGTSNVKHFKENFNYIKNYFKNDNIKLSFYTRNLPPDKLSKINEDLNNYFKIFNKTNSDLQTNNSKIFINDLVINNIMDKLIGSLKTRIGPAPDEEQRKILYNIIEFYVVANLPVDTILTWGPKKFFTGNTEESFIDLSEVLSFQTLILLNNNIKTIYPPGLRFYIFVEDFEGKFIEGIHLEKVFNSYINEFEKLVKILKINNIVTIIRTQDLILVNYNLEKLTDQLKINYDSLIKYWFESEKIGIDNSENLESYKKLEKLGWFKKIGHDTRNYYIGRLNKILGDTKTHYEKIDMTVRLLACVLMHRQYNLLKVNNKSEPVKLSFLKISGGPKKLMNGRIDIRTIQSNISKKHLSPWTAKGCLRMKNGKVLPVLKRYKELIENYKNFNNGEISLENFNLKMRFKTSFLDE